MKIAECQVYTRRWWNEQRDGCGYYASRFVADESGKGGSDDVDKRREVLRQIPLVEFDEKAVAELAMKLIAGHAVPAGETTDALHIATAAVTGADVLLTWNCKHMANPHTLPVTRKIVTDAGYICPAVMTPKTFIENLNLEA